MIVVTRAALQSQDRSSQKSQCVCDWLRDATGLDMATGLEFATRPRCPILRLKCTKFDFGWDSDKLRPRPRWGAYSAPGSPGPPSWI